MKTFLIVLILGLTLPVFAQEEKDPTIKESDVPKVVKASFTVLYPGIKAERWEKAETSYLVGFHQNNTEMSCLIDAKGVLMETETKIHVADLPKAAAEYIAKKKPGKAVTDASKIVDYQGVITYEAVLLHLNLLFDKDGKFMKETQD